MINERFNPLDRYCVADYLKGDAKLVLKSDPSDNFATDQASRTIKELTKMGVSRKILQQAICIFYRDDPSLIDHLRAMEGDKADYLKGLEGVFQTWR